MTLIISWCIYAFCQAEKVRKQLLLSGVPRVVLGFSSLGWMVGILRVLITDLSNEKIDALCSCPLLFYYKQPHTIDKTIALLGWSSVGKGYWLGSTGWFFCSIWSWLGVRDGVQLVAGLVCRGSRLLHLLACLVPGDMWLKRLRECTRLVLSPSPSHLKVSAEGLYTWSLRVPWGNVQKHGKWILPVP